MAERDGTLPTAAAGLYTSTGEDYFRSPERTIAKEHHHLDFPRNRQEFVSKFVNVDPATFGFDLARLLNDANRLFWADQALQGKISKKGFFDDEPKVNGEATLILSPGLGALRGLPFSDKLNPLVRSMLTDGTYSNPKTYLENVGFTVRETWSNKYVNTGDIDDGVEGIRDEVKKALELTDGPVILPEHSVGGIQGKVFAARNPELAKRVIFVWAGSPFPEWINSSVAVGFLAMPKKSDSFAATEEVAEFYEAGGYDDMRIISFQDERDCVLGGVVAGEVFSGEDGHASVFHQVQNLRRVVHIVNDAIDQPRLFAAA